MAKRFCRNLSEIRPKHRRTARNDSLVAEVEDLKADPTQRAIGTVIEARLDKGKGPVTTLLVQQGSLNVGDPIVVGNTYGRVRVMANDLGRRENSWTSKHQLKSQA